MKNIKHFENYNPNNSNTCTSELLILHWERSGTYRLLIKLKSPSGVEFNPDGVQLREIDAKKLINEFGAKVEER